MINICNDAIITMEDNILISGNEICIVSANNKPIIINNNNVSNYNLVIRVKENISCKIIEIKKIGGLTKIELENDSKVDYQSIIFEKLDFSYEIISKQNSNLRFNQIVLNEINESFNVLLKEENASVSINTLVISNGKNSSLKQNIIHDFKKTNSIVNNNGVALKDGNIYFETTGNIKKGMSNSNCRQLSKGIIIDSNSKITSKPILLIDEYDVKAYHGASIGKMSDEDLFYLMSRGLTRTQAFRLILDGIIRPFILQIGDEKIEKTVTQHINGLV